MAYVGHVGCLAKGECETRGHVGHIDYEGERKADYIGCRTHVGYAWYVKRQQIKPENT